MFKTLKEYFQSMGFTRYKRVLKYLENFENNIKIKSKIDREVVKDIKLLLDEKIKQLKRTYIIINILYFGVYFSFVSFIFDNFFLLSDFASLMTDVVGFLGTTIFLIGIFFVNKVRELYYQDLYLLTSHIIAIYNKNELQNEKIFDDANHYNQFINFFKKRGF